MLTSVALLMRCRYPVFESDRTVPPSSTESGITFVAPSPAEVKLALVSEIALKTTLHSGCRRKCLMTEPFQNLSGSCISLWYSRLSCQPLSLVCNLLESFPFKTALVSEILYDQKLSRATYQN